MSDPHRVNHTVIASHRTDKFTEKLRELVSQLGVTMAAKALESTREEVSMWTRDGLPKGRRKEVVLLHELHYGVDGPAIKQSRSYSEGVSFPVLRGRR